MLIKNVSKILVEENIFSHSEFTTLYRSELIKILLFGHPELSKNPSRVCFYQSTHPFNIISPVSPFMLIVLALKSSQCSLSSFKPVLQTTAWPHLIWGQVRHGRPQGGGQNRHFPPLKIETKNQYFLENM